MKKTKIAIVGAGSAGLTAARLAAQFGIDVTLFEKGNIGGDCLHTGCVPSKSMISVANKIREARRLEKLGIRTSGNISFETIKKYIRGSINHIHAREDSAAALKKLGVKIVSEKVVFDSPSSLKTASGTKYQFKKCIVATGSQPKTMSIEGVDSSELLTSDTIWNMSVMPKNLVIVGGGVIAVELAGAFASFGVQVTIVETNKNLLPNLDYEMSQAALDGLKGQGVKLLLNAKVKSASKQTKYKVVVSTQSKTETFEADKILVAIGREIRLDDLNLQKAMVEHTDCITVDNLQRTSNKNIFAAGDCVGPPFFTHLAGEQGANALLNAAFHSRRKINKGALPWTIFSYPEIAHVGKLKRDLEKDHVSFKEELLHFGDTDKATVDRESGGASLLIDKRGRLLGASIIGAHASELIGYYTYLIGKKRKLKDFAGVMQNYPTMTQALRQHAADMRIKRSSKSVVINIYLKLRGY